MIRTQLTKISLCTWNHCYPLDSIRLNSKFHLINYGIKFRPSLRWNVKCQFGKSFNQRKSPTYTQTMLKSHKSHTLKSETWQNARNPSLSHSLRRGITWHNHLRSPVQEITWRSSRRSVTSIAGSVWSVLRRHNIPVIDRCSWGSPGLVSPLNLCTRFKVDAVGREFFILVQTTGTQKKIG